MKKVAMISAVSLLVASSAFGSVAVDCYKAAMADQNVFVQNKAYDQRTSGRTGFAEARATELCGGAWDVANTLDCYKKAMADKDIFTSLKASNPRQAEEQAAKLCAQ